MGVNGLVASLLRHFRQPPPREVYIKVTRCTYSSYKISIYTCEMNYEAHVNLPAVPQSLSRKDLPNYLSPDQRPVTPRHYEQGCRKAVIAALRIAAGMGIVCTP